MEAGRSAADVGRELGVSKHTIYDWKAKYGGMSVGEAQRLRQLEDENQRDECLNASWFANLFEARRTIAALRKEYNEDRPSAAADSSGYRTPAEFAAACAATAVAGGSAAAAVARGTQEPRGRVTGRCAEGCVMGVSTGKSGGQDVA